MTAKTPDSPQESRPPTTSSTPSVPAQPTSPPAAVPPPGPGVPAPTAPPSTAPPSTTPAAAAPAKATSPAKATAPAAKAAVPNAAVTAGTPPIPPTAAARAKPPARSHDRSGGLAYVVAVIATLIAIGSTLVSVYALDVAREAKSRTADTVASRPNAAAPTTSPSQTVATPSPTAPRAQFAPEIVRADLRIPPADGCASVFVDIDTMAVGVDNGHEFYLSSCLGAPALRIDKTSGAVPTQENPTPEVCVAQLAGSTPTTELVLQIRIGLTFCLLTDKDEAVRQGIPQRVGIIEVRDMGVDKSVTVAVSTYRVPG